MSATPEGVWEAIMNFTNAAVAFRTSMKADVAEEARALVPTGVDLDAAIAAHVAAMVGEVEAKYARLVMACEAVKAFRAKHLTNATAGAVQQMVVELDALTTTEPR